MPRRLEAGPLLVIAGALLLLVSLFLDWYVDGASAWSVFEVWDVVLLVLGLAVLVAGLGFLVAELDLLDRRLLPWLVAAIAVVVASQIIDPPPAVIDGDPDTGAWLALAATLVAIAGAVLTFGRVRLSVTVEGRERRQHVAAVDARGPRDPTTENVPAVPDEGGRLFSRGQPPRTAGDGTSEGRSPTAPAPAAESPGAGPAGTDPAAAGNEPPEPNRD